MTAEQRQPVRRVAVGEMFDLAPHEQAEVVVPYADGAQVLWTIDGGNAGIKGARIG